MKPQDNQSAQPIYRSGDPDYRKQPVGLKVRSGLHAGQWSCTSCQGEVLGDQLFRPTCSFCQAT